MSVARPAHSLLGRCIATPSSRTRPAVLGAAQNLQSFHSSAQRRAKRRSQFRNVKAEELGLTKPKQLKQYVGEKFPELTPDERKEWAEKYTPEQLAALEVGEGAIDLKDMVLQGRLRDDMFRPEYVDDFATLDPRYDLKPPVNDHPVDVPFPTRDEFIDNFYKKMMRLSEKTSTDQLSRAMLRALRAVKESKGEDTIDLTFEELDLMEKDPDLLKKRIIEVDDMDNLDADADIDPKKHPDRFMTRAKALEVDQAIQEIWKREIDKITTSDNYAALKPSNVDIVADAPDGVIKAHSAEQPDLGVIPGMDDANEAKAEEDPDDPEGSFSELKRITSLTVKEIRSLLCKTLVVRFVSNQTRLGKVRSFSVMAMAGNGNGRLGIGQAKSTDMATASAAAMGLAIRTMKPVRRYENRTIFGNVTTKVSGTVAELQSRPPGFGLRVPSRVYEMCRAVGIYDLAIKFPRSKNPMNTVKATYKALTNQPDPEQIAIGRGKKLVDVRKVYYGGASQ